MTVCDVERSRSIKFLKLCYKCLKIDINKFKGLNSVNFIHWAMEIDKDNDK